MKISIKIQAIEISIDTEETYPTSTVVETLARALKEAIPPLPVVTESPKLRKVRATLAAQAQTETPTPVVEPLPEPPIITNGHDAPTATNGHDVGATNKPPRMDFHEFDSLVRAEMKRLSPEPGVMPGSTFWNEHRDPALPSWNTVLARYGCATARSLAEKLDMKPTRPGPKPETT